MLLLFLACNTPEDISTEQISPKNHQKDISLSSPKTVDTKEEEAKQEAPKPKLPQLLDISPTRASIDPYKKWSETHFKLSSISISSMGSIEHYTEKGHIPYPYSSGNVPRIHKKDRIWLEASASKDAYLYVIAQHRRNDDELYEQWFQTTMPNTEQLRLFPEGFEITEERKQLKEIYFIASLEPLEWLETLQTASCKTAGFEPEVCNILTELRYEGPPRPKCPNCYPRSKRQFQVGKRTLTGALSLNNGEPYAVGIIRFKRPID